MKKINLIIIFLSFFLCTCQLFGLDENLKDTRIYLKKIGFNYTIEELKKLTKLDLGFSKISDAGLIHLKALIN